MYHPVIGKIKNSSRALILLGIYLLQMFCFQAMVVELSGHHHLSVQKFFSPRHPDHGNNSTIAIFRTMEKHFNSKTETFSVSDVSVAHTCSGAADFAMPAAIPLPPSPQVSGRLSDDSYLRYLRMRVFRI